ncbi:MAG: pyridoxine 5'-phosphate synthase [Sulfurospirillum sp.]|nr:MAG: pyridoxine 5'-phosphate synthase [Sulfurospirillum sp.]
MLLGVNIDHIAVLREARQINDPNPIDALGIVQRAGANQITIHLREDRRHIHDSDAKNIIDLSPLPINLECSVNPDIIEIVAKLRPHRATIVPENRVEVTTEGGLDLNEPNFANIDKSVHYLKAREIETSLFIDPTIEAVRAAKTIGVEWVELHTGTYSNIYAMLFSNLSKTHHSIDELSLERSKLKLLLKKELTRIKEATFEAHEFGLKVAAGHGLNYQNVKEIAKIEGIEELNIGQSIIARSVFTGLERAIKDMIGLIQ